MITLNMYVISDSNATSSSKDKYKNSSNHDKDRIDR
jgi:hypothetical protein